MHNLIYTILANLSALPFTLALVAILYFTPSVVALTALTTLILYGLELVSSPSPYLEELVKEYTEYLGAQLESGQAQASAVLLRLFFRSNHAMLAIIFGLAVCPTLVSSGLLAVLGLATALDIVIYLPLAAALPMIGWKSCKTLYPYIRFMVILPFLGLYIGGCALVRCITLTHDRASVAISHHNQRKAARFYQRHMSSQHCSHGHWNCQEREHWPNPCGQPHPLCSDHQSFDFPLAAAISYWGGQVVYFRHEQHIRQLRLELDWTLCRGANRHLYVTPADVQYECQTGCTVPLQQPFWACPRSY